MGRHLSLTLGVATVLSFASAYAALAVEPAKPQTSQAADDLTKIRFILIARDQCELLEPGYGARNRQVFEAWRKPRIEAVQKVETDPVFRSQRAEMLTTVRKQLAAGAKSPEEQEDIDEFRVTCDSRLPEVMARADEGPPVPQNVQSAGAVVVTHSERHKSATQVAGSAPAALPSQP